MKGNLGSGMIRTIIFFVLAVPVIWYLVSFSMKRNSQFEGKAQECADTCTAEGYSGSEFKWAALSKADCQCIGEE